MTYLPTEKERIIEAIIPQWYDENRSGEGEHLLSNVLDHLHKRFKEVDTRDGVVSCFCNNRLIDTKNVTLLTTNPERKSVMTLFRIMREIEAIVSESVDKRLVQIRICPYEREEERFLFPVL